MVGLRRSRGAKLIPSMVMVIAIAVNRETNPPRANSGYIILIGGRQVDDKRPFTYGHFDQLTKRFLYEWHHDLKARLT
jgi:hypothetical protein